ncbi:PD-(D/E)XK nuclease family protein [Brachybacterium huguangmaarense]
MPGHRPSDPSPDGIARRVVLVPPDPGSAPSALAPAEIDEVRRRALDAFDAGADVLVHAVPGAGRTRLALTASLTAALGGSRRGGPLLLLAPRRSAAARLRDAVALAGAADRVHVSTPAALGFTVLRARAALAGAGAPTLVTGGEQDALLRDLVASLEAPHGAAGAGSDGWAVALDPAARSLPGFRAELRDVLSRAAELGLGPADLEELAVRRDRPAWRDAARVQRLYLDVLDLEAAAALDAGPRLDAGRMVREAARAIEQGEGPEVAGVVVDDAQDLTAAGIALVRALRGSGVPVLLTSCPDAAVDTFRGAVPDAARRVLAAAPAGPGSRSVHETVLVRSERTPAGARRVVDALCGRLPLAGAPTGIRRSVGTAPMGTVSRGEMAAQPSADPVEPAVAVLRCPGPLEEARRIAGVLRDLHHARGVAYDEMAIVCRSGGAVDDLADLLQREGLPVSTAERPRPLREEPVVADLLTILDLALDEAPPSPAVALELLRGPFGDADALRLRRIRRALLHAHEAADAVGGEGRGEGDGGADGGGGDAGSRPAVGSDELLARALVEDDVPGLPAPGEGGRSAAPVHRIRRMIRAVRALGAAAAPPDALWAAWEAARVAEGWRTASLERDDLDASGARGRLADRRLDAVVALFASADRFTARRPLADARVFAQHVRDQAVAEDSLAPRARLAGHVRIVTPTQIAGEEVDTVVLAHVQEGAWPNTRLRSTLFGAAELALAAERDDLPTQPGALRAIQRDTVVADEVRLAVSALARARARILVTAVEDDDLAPSALVDVIERAAGPSWVDPEAIAADPGPAPDPRRLVAALRRRLVADVVAEHADRDGAGDLGAAALLASLAAGGAPGAEPAAWYHQAPSSTAPILEPDRPVALSPSALERAHECPQSWLLERSGGSRSAGPAQSIGTAIHRIAQDHPAGSGDVGPDGAPRDLLAELTALLAPLHLERAWSTRRLLTRAEDAVRLLAAHLEVAGPPLAVEAPFAVENGGVRLRGTIDRIEGDATGIRVVDLKTGGSAKSAASAATDLQLAAYQSAIRDGALADVLGDDAPERLSGAQLVYVGTGARSAAVRTQGALTHAEDPGWFDAIVHDVAREARGAHVAARANAHCDRCTVRRTCSLWPEGAEL